MSEIIKIFFMNAINDIDNVLIISAVIRKYGYSVKSLFPYIVLFLTFSRTIYVMVIDLVIEVPGLRLITGVIILFVAIRLAWSIEKEKGIRQIPSIPVVKILLIVLATGFSVCLDSVMITSEISTNPFFAAVGIFLSISCVLIIFNLFSDILGKTSWIQIIAGGLIAHIAILSMVKDPITKNPLLFIEDLLEIHIDKWINVFALDIALIIIVVGLVRRIQNGTSLYE